MERPSTNNRIEAVARREGERETRGCGDTERGRRRDTEIQSAFAPCSCILCSLVIKRTCPSRMLGHISYLTRKALWLVGWLHHCRAPEGADDEPIEPDEQCFDPFDDEIETVLLRRGRLCLLCDARQVLSHLPEEGL